MYKDGHQKFYYDNEESLRKDMQQNPVRFHRGAQSGTHNFRKAPYGKPYNHAHKRVWNDLRQKPRLHPYSYSNPQYRRGPQPRRSRISHDNYSMEFGMGHPPFSRVNFPQPMWACDMGYEKYGSNQSPYFQGSSTWNPRYVQNSNYFSSQEEWRGKKKF